MKRALVLALIVLAAGCAGTHQNFEQRPPLELAGMYTTGDGAIWLIVVFAVSSLAFGVETALISFIGEKGVLARIRRLGPILLPSYVALVETAVTLLWLSVAVT